jgi:hypothetical protein
MLYLYIAILKNVHANGEHYLPYMSGKGEFTVKIHLITD